MLIVAAIGALAAVVLAGGSQAKASTVAGRITGAPIPATGAGEAFVRAVNLLTGEVAAVDGTDAAGRYRLTVPKGAFALFPTVVTLRSVFSPKPTKVRLRRGQRKSVGLPARQAAVVLRPIVALPDNSFTGATGEFSPLNRGLRDMLISDLLLVKTATCDVSLVDRSQLFLGARKTELALVRRGLVDPATAIRPGMLIEPTRGIRGTITVSGGRMRIGAEIYKWGSKKTLHRTSVEGAQEEFFELESDLARRIAARLCEQPPPISGTFSGSVDYSAVTSLPSDVRIDWTGTVDLEPQDTLGRFPGTDSYNVRTGSLTANVRGSGEASGCTFTGSATFDLAKVNGGLPVPAMSTTEGAIDTYQFFLPAGGSAISAVLSNCQSADDNGKTKLVLLLPIRLLPVGRTLTVDTEGVYTGSAQAAGTESEGAYTWTWSLRG